MQKRKKDANPPGGMGNGLERSYSEIFFTIINYNTIKMILFLFFLIQNEPKSLLNAKIKDFGKWGDPWGGFEWPKSHFSDSTSSYFLLQLIKYINIIKLKYSQNHFETTFGSTHF